MLCLKRTEGQSIVIASNIRVTINRIRGDEVQVGIEADRSIPVLRSELIVPSVTPLTSAALVAEYGEREGTP